MESPLELPQIKISNLYRTSMKTKVLCFDKTFIHSADPHVKRRVYLESNYRVNCSHLEIPVNNQILRETVELHKSQITEICEQGRQSSSESKVCRITGKLVKG